MSLPDQHCAPRALGRRTASSSGICGRAGQSARLCGGSEIALAPRAGCGAGGGVDVCHDPCGHQGGAAPFRALFGTGRRSHARVDEDRSHRPHQEGRPCTSRSPSTGQPSCSGSRSAAPRRSSCCEPSLHTGSSRCPARAWLRPRHVLQRGDRPPGLGVNVPPSMGIIHTSTPLVQPMFAASILAGAVRLGSRVRRRCTCFT